MKCCFSCAWLFRGDRNFFDAFNSLERNSKRTVSAKFKLLIPMFWLVLSSANAATWYVDNTATGSHNGSSWANAWTSISQISGVSAGDTVYISGGPAGSSQTYPMSGSWLPIAGTTSAPITYQIGQDSAHNGTAIFSNNGAGNWLNSGVVNVTISGNAGDGQMHFVLTNFVTGMYGNGTFSYMTLSYINFGSLSGYGGIYEYSGGNGPYDIDHCYIYMAPGTADAAIQFSDATSVSTWGYKYIHDNTIYTPCLPNSATGCDGIRGNGTVTIYNNHITQYQTSGYTGGQHADCIQWMGGNYVLIYNNFLQGVGNSCFFGDIFGNISHWWLINNVCVKYGGGEGMGIAPDSGATTNQHFSDIVEINNVMDGANLTIGDDNGKGYTFDTTLMANNVVIGASYDTTANPTCVLADNLTLSEASAATDFVHYVANAPTSLAACDFHLRSNANMMIGQGTNLTSYITSDVAGTPRPAPPTAWDIGAYNYGNNLASTNPIIQVSPGSLSFGTTLTNASVSNSFTIQNIGGAVLSGTASVGAPFSIVSGGSYNLGSNQSQTVMVAFSPAMVSNYSQTVTLTGGGGTNAIVSGSVSTALANVQFQITPTKQFILTVAGQNGHTYDIQATQDFITWTVIGTVTMGASGSLNFTDTNAASFSKRFYRIRE